MPSFRSTSTGDLPAALSAAIAAALDCPESEVQVVLSAAGLDGPVTVHLEIEGLAASGVDGDSDVLGDQASEPSDAVEPPEVEPPEVEPSEVEPSEDEALDEDVTHDEEPVEDAPDEEPRLDLDSEADAAADFLEGLLDALDLPGDLRIHVAPEQVEIELLDIGSGVLIGRRGQTLDAIQELARCVLQREFQRRSRVLIDAEGYRARRLEKLLEKAEEAIDAVLDTGEPERLEPMDVFERKAVHNLVAGIEGITSRSQGREPARRVVLEAD